MRKRAQRLLTRPEHLRLVEVAMALNPTGRAPEELPAVSRSDRKYAARILLALANGENLIDRFFRVPKGRAATDIDRDILIAVHYRLTSEARQSAAKVVALFWGVSPDKVRDVVKLRKAAVDELMSNTAAEDLRILIQVYRKRLGKK